MRFNKVFFKEVMNDKNLTNKKLTNIFLAHGIEISEDGVKQWRKTASNVVPSLDKLEVLSKIFNVSPMSFIESDNKLIKHEIEQSKNTISIPIIEALAGCGAAGILDQLKLSEDRIEIDKRIFPSSFISDKLSMIRIAGDSMEPYLEENDWAIIQMRNGYDVQHINGIYLIAHGENVQIKRCAFQPDGSCMLISDNKSYPIETAYAGDWDIVGKIVARLKVGSPMLIKE